MGAHARLGLSVALLLGASMASDCGARSELDVPPPPAPKKTCPVDKPTCVAHSASDACGAPTTVAPTCDDTDFAWSCPAESHVYARATPTTDACLPFSDPSTGVATVFGWGLSSIQRLAVDGHCLWIAENIRLPDGSTERNVGFEPDLDAPFGSCPTKSLSTPKPIVTIDGGDDGSVLVQLDGGYTVAGETRVIYRAFALDATSPVGVTLLGGGIAHWDEQLQRIVVPSPSSTAFPWGTDLDLGDAVLTSPDGAYGFVWGCTGGDGFTAPCRLARIDANDAVELRYPPGAWLPTTAPKGAETFFSSGTWISSVFATTTGFEQVYIAGFGKTVEGDTAPSLLDDWAPAPTLVSCDLPAGDAHSFCAGPVAHPEIADPTRPNEVPISYSIGSTGPPTSKANDYWPRLVFVDE